MTGLFDEEVHRQEPKDPKDLTPAEVLGIVDMFARGNAMVTVALVYMVPVEAVKDIVNGRMFSDITGLTPRRNPYEEKADHEG